MDTLDSCKYGRFLDFKKKQLLTLAITHVYIIIKFNITLTSFLRVQSIMHG
jgi:hypothetical protein